MMKGGGGMRMIITIDGPVATGKSVVAKQLARAIGFIFFDTGAMYRALTYGILKHHIDVQQEAAMAHFLEQFHLDIRVVNREWQYQYEGEDITRKIREREVTEHVSAVAALKSVRDRLVSLQRELAIGVNAVFEGRDMGTTVFPEATLKIFLTGRNEIRAQRRYRELQGRYPDLTLEQCLEDLIKRDTYDSTRTHSPLIQAQDAHVIDTSDLTIEEVVYKILEYKDALKTKAGDLSY